MALPTPAGLAALLHCELAVGVRMPGATAPWTTLHIPVGTARHVMSQTMHCGKRESWLASSCICCGLIIGRLCCVVHNSLQGMWCCVCGTVWHDLG